jgi:hypothetical protein
MGKTQGEARNWAQEQFGDAELGDGRRTVRWVKMIAGAIESPSGRLSEVYRGKELDAAYDFVENGCVPTWRLEAAVGKATARQCQGQRVYVAVDGSSLSLTPRRIGIEKGFGPIGKISAGWRGIKVNTALAMTEGGTVVGILAQQWWTRPEAARRTLKQCKKDRMRKKPRDKETVHWLESTQRSAERLEAHGARGWFQLDREADAWPILCSLATNGHWFTVRSSWNRRLAVAGDRQYLRSKMASTKPIAFYELDVPERGRRQGRKARMAIHAADVTLLLREKMNGKRQRPLQVRAVWTHEVGTTPPGEEPLDWMLLTNAPVDTVGAAQAVVGGYAMRWRIEEFHRTWKTGSCEVETTQLRSRDATIRWATVLGVVAARVERIKRLGREQPDRPASDELSPVEIEVLVALKRRIKKRSESIPDAIPSMSLAALWLAEIGGYTGRSSGGPPGSTTIRRGLERLLHGVEAVIALRE